MNENPKWLEKATTDEAISHGLTEKELLGLKELLGRDLNMVELGICAALYSEHCSYKSTKLHLSNLPSEGERVLQGPGENAGVVDIGDGQAVAFKVESHNHPTFIEPFQGAATGVGGILRDVFTMGARPLAVMNALRFGAISHEKTRYLVSRAVAGIGTYGNCVGIPTVGGELFFHDSYNGNCLVNAFALGLVDSDKIFLGTASGVGNPVIYVGSKTGRDGIHGATMASESFTDDAEAKRPTVQVGDPFQEKLLLEACLEVMQTGAVVGIQDMGAAGMTSSTYEMAERAGTGVRIHLDRIPQREENMNPYEIMLSESQERMLLVVDKGREAEVLKCFEHWELDGVVIGEVIAGNNVELFWNEECISSMPAPLLTSSVPKYRWPESEPASYRSKLEFDAHAKVSTLDFDAEQLAQNWLEFIGSVNVCSRRPVFNQYDSTVRSNTVVHPGGDAGVIRVKAKNAAPEKGIAMTLDCNSRYCGIDPRQGAALSLAEAYRNISAVGAKPIGLSDCLNFGSPEKPEGMWQIAEGIRGLAEAARAFEVPVVSGNVSLYNETMGSPILPTPLVALVGLIENADLCVPAHFKAENRCVMLIGDTNPLDFGGSEYLAFATGLEQGGLPLLDYELEIKTADLVRDLIAAKLLDSCHDVSSGGLANALVEACCGTYSECGAKLSSHAAGLSAVELLFSETGARYLISCDRDNENRVREMAKKAGIPISLSGVSGGDVIEIAGVAQVDLLSASTAFRGGLSEMFE